MQAPFPAQKPFRRGSLAGMLLFLYELGDKNAVNFSAETACPSRR